jgi:hypothetical protein
VHTYTAADERRAIQWVSGIRIYSPAADWRAYGKAMLYSDDLRVRLITIL